MSAKKTTQDKSKFTIEGELAEVLNAFDLKESNWTVHVTKNQMKSVTAIFRMKQPEVKLVAK